MEVKELKSISEFLVEISFVNKTLFAVSIAFYGLGLADISFISDRFLTFGTIGVVFVFLTGLQNHYADRIRALESQVYK